MGGFKTTYAGELLTKISNLRQLVVQFMFVSVIRVPVNLRKAEIQLGHEVNHSDVGQVQVDVGTKYTVNQTSDRLRQSKLDPVDMRLFQD